MIMKDWRRLALFCLRLMVPELVEFDRGRRIMTFLARRFGGKYDGWEMENTFGRFLGDGGSIKRTSPQQEHSPTFNMSTFNPLLHHMLPQFPLELMNLRTDSP